MPGARALTRTPCGPSSVAGAREREHGAFRGRIDQRAGMAAFAAGERGQIDDARTAAALRRSDEMRRGGAR